MAAEEPPATLSEKMKASEGDSKDHLSKEVCYFISSQDVSLRPAMLGVGQHATLAPPAHAHEQTGTQTSGSTALDQVLVHVEERGGGDLSVRSEAPGSDHSEQTQGDSSGHRDLTPQGLPVTDELQLPRGRVMQAPVSIAERHFCSWAPRKTTSSATPPPGRARACSPEPCCRYRAACHGWCGVRHPDVWRVCEWRQANVAPWGR